MTDWNKKCCILSDKDVNFDKGEALNCILCLKMLSGSKDAMLKHMVNAHNGKGLQRCPKCPTVYPNQASMKNHLALVHER